jgi:hypothetical protein
MKCAFGVIWLRLLQAFVVLALCACAFAQGGQGELTGQVTDTTGALVSGVEVQLTQNATGEVRTTVTTSAGTYNFPALPIVGTYTLEIKAKGFKSVKVQNIVATVGQVTTRDIKLDVGAATEQVTVEAGAQMVQTEDTSVSENIDRHVWQDMPLEDRTQNSFIALIAGAEPAANAMLTTDRGAAVNGTRSGAGNFMVDGFDNNDQGLGGGQSIGTGPNGANTQISPDAIEEYRVIDGTPAAEYGKAGGFVADSVLKSGTNQWHGSLFEYNRIQALTANSFFSNLAGDQDHLVRNQFGGSVGGPIIKDKTFFFFTAESQRLRFSVPLAVNTTTPQFLSAFQNGGIENFLETSPSGMCNNPTFVGAINSVYGTSKPVAPCAGMIPVMYGKVFAAEQSVMTGAADPMPLCVPGAANCTALSAIGQGMYTGGIYGAEITGTYAPPVTYPMNIYGTETIPQYNLINQMRYSAKVDHKLGARDQLSGTYLYDNNYDFDQYGGGQGNYGPDVTNPARAQNAGVTWTHTFSPTILNQARMAYVRNTSNFPANPATVGMPASESLFDETSFAPGMASNLPQFFTENEFIYKDDLSVTRGKNNFKGGAEYRRTRNGSSFDAYKYGYLQFNSLEDMMSDAVFTNSVENYFLGGPEFGSMYAATASLNPTTGALPEYYRGYRANEVAAYLQDSWRVHPRLTVNMGMRWEYFGPPHNFQPGLDGNFYTGVPEIQPNPCPTVPTPGVCNGQIANPFWLPGTDPAWGAFATGTVQQRNHDIWNKDLEDWGPRLGFAYDALGNQKVVIRAGFGISYDRMYNNIFENLRFNPPFFAAADLGVFNPSGIPVTNAIASQIVTYPFTGRATFFGNKISPELRAMDENLRAAYYEQAHLGVQYQLAKDMVLESNYVGTFGHRLLGVLGRNNYDGEYISGNYNATPISSDYGNNNFRTNCCSSNYHGWQTTLRKRFTDGLEFNANYTFSKGMDNISDAFTTKGAAGGYPTDSQNLSVDYGPADYNVKSRIVASWVYNLPFAKSNRWLGGWNASGIVTWQTGPDFSVTNSNADSNGNGRYNGRANYIGPGKITDAINHNQEPWRGYLTPNNPTTGLNSDWGMLNFTPGLSCPANVNMGLWCDGAAVGEMERNTLVGPAFFNTDFGIKKTFKVTERTGLRFEANFFNLFNHTNFQIAPAQYNLAASNFGVSTATFNNQQSGGPRVTQLAVRFDF